MRTRSSFIRAYRASPLVLAIRYVNRPMMGKNRMDRPYSEQYRLAAEDRVAKDAAASLLEETRSAVFSQRVMRLVAEGVPVSRAEHQARASLDNIDYVEKMVDARRVANLAKVKEKVLEMRYWEQQGANATRRAEMRM